MEWINDTTDLCHAPDEGGWYLRRFPDHKTSQLFPSRQAALDMLAACNGPTPPLQPLIDWN